MPQELHLDFKNRAFKSSYFSQKGWKTKTNSDNKKHDQLMIKSFLPGSGGTCPLVPALRRQRQVSL